MRLGLVLIAVALTTSCAREKPRKATSPQPTIEAPDTTKPRAKKEEPPFDTPLPLGASTCAADSSVRAELEAIANCVRKGLPAIQDEPDKDDLAGFVAAVAPKVGSPPCPAANAKAPLTLADGRDVHWSRRGGNWSHFEDGTAVVDITYSFWVDDCGPVEFDIDFSMGGP